MLRMVFHGSRYCGNVRPASLTVRDATATKLFGSLSGTIFKPDKGVPSLQPTGSPTSHPGRWPKIALGKRSIVPLFRPLWYGGLPKWPTGIDCKSIGLRPSMVRIHHPPPVFAAGENCAPDEARGSPADQLAGLRQRALQRDAVDPAAFQFGSRRSIRCCSRSLRTPSRRQPAGMRNTPTQNTPFPAADIFLTVGQ